MDLDFEHDHQPLGFRFWILVTVIFIDGMFFLSIVLR